ncbi:MAG: hypothetical protein U0V56_10400 [Actinomycetota bacterium]
MRVVPVLAIGDGAASQVAFDHAIALRGALRQFDPVEAGATAPVKIWRLDAYGNVDERL